MKFIVTKKAPSAVGPYSQGVLVKDTLYVSGQIPFVPETMTLVSDDIRKQTKQSLTNILAIVEEAGLKKTDIVKCNVYMTNLSDFGAMNEVYAEFFGDHKPARAAVEVRRLPKDVQIEIEAIAYKS
ncbi:MAG: reactive intermediate/imine deaminase [Tenericutes bacterium GWC2_39_45]|nr:MAG: reactive intermediate/imine deaminase [Tenericutes bacterium GWA2_38_26]OHE30360.1 MAG: reactive intermediate/imine deaminase [Tenericutes bacterium GWC2_39_45]OHE41157.1 MAG: reactive intermediate/imine deaminase [Tenericutes bacterium GWF2_38_8]HCB66669.1 reactive intermediate/imine deaminase [Acholeplasmataceae bacterium]